MKGTYGKLEGCWGDNNHRVHVPSSNAASDSFDVTLFTNENCNKPACDPGSPSVYHPDGNPAVVPLEASSAAS